MKRIIDKEKKTEILDHDINTEINIEKMVNIDLIDFTQNKVEFSIDNGKYQTKIISKKNEGVTPGLFTKTKTGELGMLKFPKYLTNKVPIPATNYNVIIEELAALGIARILGLPASDCRLVQVKISKNQIENTSSEIGLPEFKGHAIIIPALFIKFSNEAISLEKAKIISGNDKRYCQGRLRPVYEGINSNKILGKDFGLFDIYTFLCQDHDTWGKEPQNEMINLKTSRLFTIDTALNKSNLIDIRKDGRFYNLFYKNKIRATGKIVRNKSFRNLSISDDAPFMEKLSAVILCIEKRDEIIKFTENLKNQLAKLKVMDENFNRLLSDYKIRLEEYKNILNERIDKLEEIFKYYLEYHKQDQKIVSSIIALEEFLSESGRMYSKEGIPLRAVEIPYEQHFFFDNRLIIEKYNIFIKLDKETANKVFKKMQILLGDSVKIKDDQIICEKNNFIKYINSDRVKLLQHPETVNIRTALSTENKDISIKYFDKNFYKSLNIYSKEFKIKIKSIIEKNKSYKLDSIYYLKTFETLLLHIFNEIKEDLLTNRLINEEKDWGALIEIKSKIIKNQQYTLNSILKNNKNFISILNGESITELFSKADLLDISNILNIFLIKALGKQELFLDKNFLKIINRILSTPEEIVNFQEFRDNAELIYKDINRFNYKKHKEIEQKYREKTKLYIYLKNATYIKEYKLETHNQIKFFSEYEINKDGNCGFNALGVSREEAVTILNSLTDNKKIRSDIILELLEAMSNHHSDSSEINPTQFMDDKINYKLKNLFEDLQNKRMKLQNSIERIRRIVLASKTKLTEQGNTEESILYHLKNDKFPVNVIQHFKERKINEKQLKKDILELEKQYQEKLSEILQDSDIFKAYVDSYAKGLWLGTVSMRYIAVAKDIGLYIWGEDSKTNRLKLLYDPVLPLDLSANTINVLIRSGHYNFLVEETSPKPKHKDLTVSISALTKGGVSIMPDRSKVSETEENLSSSSLTILK